MNIILIKAAAHANKTTLSENVKNAIKKVHMIITPFVLNTYSITRLLQSIATATCYRLDTHLPH